MKWTATTKDGLILVGNGNRYCVAEPTSDGFLLQNSGGEYIVDEDLKPHLYPTAQAAMAMIGILIV